MAKARLYKVWQRGFLFEGLDCNSEALRVMQSQGDCGLGAMPKTFLSDEQSIAKRIRTTEEKAAYAQRRDLREKVFSALKVSRAK